jgi:hypothetical protein
VVKNIDNLPNYDLNVHIESDRGDFGLNFINEDNLKECPHVRTEINGEQGIAVVDSGAEVFLLSEELCNRLLAGGLLVLHIPVVSETLVFASGASSKENKERRFDNI